MIRVLVADDEPLIRAGIRMILTSAEDIDVVAEAGNGREAVDLARAHAVDVALIDIQMPGMDGLTALAELRQAAPSVRPLSLTTFGERENVLRALNSGLDVDYFTAHRNYSAETLNRAGFFRLHGWE